MASWRAAFGRNDGWYEDGWWAGNWWETAESAPCNSWLTTESVRPDAWSQPAGNTAAWNTASNTAESAHTQTPAASAHGQPTATASTQGAPTPTAPAQGSLTFSSSPTCHGSSGSMFSWFRGDMESDEKTHMANVDTRGGMGTDVEASVPESTAASSHTDPCQVQSATAYMAASAQSDASALHTAWLEREAELQQLLAHEWAKGMQLPPLLGTFGGDATGSVRRVKSTAVRLNPSTRHNSEHNVHRQASVTTHNRPTRIRWSSLSRSVTPIQYRINAVPVPGAVYTAPPGVAKTNTGSAKTSVRGTGGPPR